MSNKPARFQRRLRQRRLEQEIEARRLEQPKEPKHPLGDPRVEEDRRQVERRSKNLSPAEVDDWLKRNGISGGDRRQGSRRQGDRRRR